MHARKHVRRAADAFAQRDYDAVIVWGEAALVNAADAVLLSQGFRILAVTKAHQARFAFPGLPPIFDQNAGLIDRVRGLRNASIYEDETGISATEAKRIVDLANEAIAEVAKLLP